MDTIIDWSIKQRKAILLLLIFLTLGGAAAYLSIPKESEPDVAIPMINVSMVYDGITSEDAERLLLKPMEKELRSIEGLKSITSVANQGYGTVTLEFDAGFDSDAALDDVRAKVDIAKTKLPAGGEEPEVNEVNVALFPVLSLNLSGNISERQLLRIARKLKDDIEALSGVLEADIGGEREETLEIIIDPLVLETYSLDFETVLNSIQRNNQLVAAGAIDNGGGRQVIKVPGVIKNADDMLALPVKVVGNKVVTFRDIATVRRTFKSPEGFVRVNGQASITLDVSKRVGSNIIDTINQIKQLVNAHQEFWPPSVAHSYILDKSNRVTDMLGDLQNNISSAIVMVMLVIIAALGIRSSILVGLAIPISFLISILIIKQLGFTLNIVVLFSLILVVGMLVDGAIVVTELAKRNIEEGMPLEKAYSNAAKRMSMPVIASTATTLAVFFPLTAWPGTLGEFIKYLPMTVAICLSVSLVVALVFLPVLGSWIGGGAPKNSNKQEPSITGKTFTARYLNILRFLLKHPGKTLTFALISVSLTYAAYGIWGKGMELFPDGEPESAQVLVHARGDLSVYEKDALLQTVEQRFLGMHELKSVYARSYNQASQNYTEDVVGILQFQFINWRQRREASEILLEMSNITQDIAGMKLEFRKEDSGPSGGKPIELQISGLNQSNIVKTVQNLQKTMGRLGGYKDIEDSLPLPGVEWQLEVDKESAARFGADVSMIGSAIQMMTGGYRVSEFRPSDSDEEIDITIRFPPEQRTLETFNHFNVNTSRGMIPLSNFVKISPTPKTGAIQRSNSKRVIALKADVLPGELASERLQALRNEIEKTIPLEGIKIEFKGEDEDQKETLEFLSSAFSIAVVVMLLILVIQFNSYYQGLLVLSAIIFSTAGVLLGLLVTAQPFGVVMVGLGVIALAGIVVNNNIVLIDTYNALIREGYTPTDAAIKTGALRLRPVLLTAGTTVLGLIPMVLAVNIDLIHRDITFGAPSTQMWTQLSTAIAGGLSFATVLTLLLTPCLLVLGAETPDKAKKLTSRIMRFGQQRAL